MDIYDEEIIDAIATINAFGDAIAAAEELEADAVQMAAASPHTMAAARLRQGRAMAAFTRRLADLLRKRFAEDRALVAEFLADTQPIATALVAAGELPKADVERAADVIRSLGAPARFLDDPVMAEVTRQPPVRAVSPIEASIVQDILALASSYVRRSVIDGWTNDQRQLATDWAAACHADASDNDVDVPPRPDFVPEPQSGIPGWWLDETAEDPAEARRRAKVIGTTVAEGCPGCGSEDPAWMHTFAPETCADAFHAPGAAPRFANARPLHVEEHILPNGRNVRVVDRLERRDYTEDAMLTRRAGALGVIVDTHDSHGLCYDVRHDDLSIGTYDPDELAVVCRKCVDCEGSDHHWIEGSCDADDPEAVEEFREDHPGVELTDQLALGYLECKHCPAIKPWEDPDEADELVVVSPQPTGTLYDRLWDAISQGSPETDTDARLEFARLVGAAWLTRTDADHEQEMAELRRKVFDTLERKQAAERERDNVYVERTHLVALVAALCRQAGLPVGLGEHDPNDAAWDPSWRTIVFVEIPDGLGNRFQASWHVGADQRELVAYLPKYDKPWDGHTTREKYLRIAATAERLATGMGETVFQRLRTAEATLRWLDRLGGLGAEKHAAIEKALNPLGGTSVTVAP